MQTSALAQAQREEHEMAYCGYEMLGMLAKFRGEERPGGYYETAVAYLTPDQKWSFEVHVIAGRLVDRRGWPIDADTTEFFGADLWSPYGIFVMDECGRIFLTYEHETGLFHHSTFLAGGPVSSAGEILVVDGWIVYLDNASGHYQPPARFASQVVHRLKAMGADLTHTEIRWLF